MDLMTMIEQDTSIIIAKSWDKLRVWGRYLYENFAICKCQLVVLIILRMMGSFFSLMVILDKKENKNKGKEEP